MTDADILLKVKTDLDIAAGVTSRDTYLNDLIALAKQSIEREGITIRDTVEDGMLIEMYAAFLFRKRKEETYAMPRSLRYMLNNRLLSEKMGETQNGN